MATLSQVCRLRGHEERIWCVAWRPLAEPPQLASCGSDRIIRIWTRRAEAAPDAEDAWVLRTEIDAAERHSRTVRSVSWSPSGDLLAATSFDASVSIWRERPADSEDGPGFGCAGMVTGHENEVKAAAFSPSGDYMATCSRDKSVWIYETADNFEYECIAVLQSHTQDVKLVRWHPAQDVLFSCSYDDTIKVWGPDGDDWACKHTLSGHDSTVWGISFDPTGSRFVSCSDDRTLRIWAPEGEQAAKPAAVDGGAAARPSVAAAAYISPLFRGGALAAAGGPVAAGSQGNAQPRCAPADAACDWRTTAIIEDAHPRPIYSVAWLPQGEGPTAIASACGDNCVRVFRPRNEEALEDWSCIAEVEAHGGDANCVAWCPTPLPGGGFLLASAGDDAEVALWRLSA